MVNVGDSRGRGVKCRAITIVMPQHCRGNYRVLILRSLPRESSYCEAQGRAKSIVLTTRLSPGAGVYSMSLNTEKSKYPPFPVGGRAVVTNEWCITVL